MDREHFQELISEYQHKVYNTCIGLVMNAEDAQELTQDVFVEVFKSYGDFEGRSTIGTWIYRIAVNKSLEQLRKSRRQKRKGHETSIDEMLGIEAAPFFHPGVAVENKERSSILFGAISSLIDDQRVAFTLSKVEGLTYEEISKVMNKSISSIESLLHRAKVNLKKKLTYYYENVERV